MVTLGPASRRCRRECAGPKHTGADAGGLSHIRAVASDLIGDASSPLPTSKSQEKKWSKEIRARLSGWVDAEIVPLLKQDLLQQGLPAAIRADGDKVFIDYKPLD